MYKGEGKDFAIYMIHDIELQQPPAPWIPFTKKKKQLKVVQNSLYTKLAQIYLFKYDWTDIKLRKTIMKIRALTEAKKTRNCFGIVI